MFQDSRRGAANEQLICQNIKKPKKFSDNEQGWFPNFDDLESFEKILNALTW